ncbi:MAG: DUF1549 domain-containing protein, partial [Planctomycetaceae bacterium]|nr:DUF1549 domain-containing protein [Planctomycetaceae bacterium]
MNAKLHFLAVMSFVLLNVTEVTEADERTAVSSADVDFSRDVFSVLRRSCFECHGPEKQEGELRLDSAAAIAESGTIEPGRPDESELLRRLLLPRGHEELMPAVGDPLPGKEVAALRRWIQNGALWPADFEVPPHWAYVAPSLPDVPEPVKTAGALNGWGRNEVDRFVAQRLQEEGLHPSPDADPETMIRRVFFDTIGLPPTLAEVDRYLQDPSDAAYERVVDDLLSRPQFGEKWARHWLDLARYADSHGFQRDDLRDVWAYRDWVIRAMNQDMPFDRFTIEQLAGDLLPDATEEQRIATGFHRCTPTNVEAGSIPEETRVEQVLDRVNTTGAVWLGTTMECAQCHDHKYDPFTRQDYYRLLAYFNHTELEADRKDPKQPSSIAFQGPSMPLSNPEREAQRAELTAKAQQIETQIAQHRQQLDKDLDTWATELARRLKSAPVTQTMAVR